MATKPTQIFVWNTDNLNDTAPNSAKIALGWVVDEQPPSSYFNWILKYLAKVAAYILDGVLVGTGATSGLDVTGGPTGSQIGVKAIGTGDNYGLKGTGGPSAAGSGVRGIGGAGGGRGGYFSGTGNYDGIRAEAGTGTGNGAVIVGGDDGGGGGGVGLDVTGGPAAYGAVLRSNASGAGIPLRLIKNNGNTNEVVALFDGALDLSTATDPTSTDAVLNKLYPQLLVKARGVMTVSGLHGASINVASVTTTSTYFEVTMAQAMLDADYDVHVNIFGGAAGVTNARIPMIDITSSTVFRIYLLDGNSAAVDPSVGDKISFTVTGAQT